MMMLMKDALRDVHGVRASFDCNGNESRENK